jgi:PleD family two-component response regulator
MTLENSLINEKKPSMLLVEDDKLYLNSLEFVLSKDFNLDIAEDLETALKKLNSNNYNVVSTDGAIPQYKGGYVGDHGRLSEEDYRGNIVAKTAKEKGIYVLGVTSEPEKLTEADRVLKKPIDIFEYIKILKEKANETKVERN